MGPKISSGSIICWLTNNWLRRDCSAQLGAAPATAGEEDDDDSSVSISGKEMSEPWCGAAGDEMGG
jgi:hypothetical protein